MTMQEVVDFILTYIEHNSKKNKNKNQNHETKETKSVTFSYGRSDEYSLDGG